MVKVLRYAGFLASAVWTQLASGIGLAALAVAFFMGWRRIGIVWLAAPTVLFAAGAVAWFGKVTGQSKVSTALSNFGFEIIVTLTICLIGYIAGRIARRFV